MTHKRRRLIVSLCIALAVCAGTVYNGYIQPQLDDAATQTPPSNSQSVSADTPDAAITGSAQPAAQALAQLLVKGRAPKTGYSRDQFGQGWGQLDGCSMRNVILQRDLKDTALDTNDGCIVESGTLHDIYTNKTIKFSRAKDSAAVQIDHIVALSDSWQKGAQQISRDQREALANDPLNLIAVDGPTNQAKGDSDAATWLPPNKPYRCRYVARQIAVKARYNLWVTQAEHDAMQTILNTCPGQVLPLSSQAATAQ